MPSFTNSSQHYDRKVRCAYPSPAYNGTMTHILWFRQDLRLHDNPALIAAAKSGANILPIFILDDDNAGTWKKGGASRWWLHHSLDALNQSLGGKLRFFKGDAKDIIPQLAKEISAENIYWNRCYEPWRIARDTEIKQHLKDDGINAHSFNGSLLFEPHKVLKDDDTPYRVFTPYYRKGCLGKQPAPRAPQNAPTSLNLSEHACGIQLDALELLPTIPWDTDMQRLWQPGEDGAAKRLAHFLEHGLSNYKEGRDRPDMENISRLSPHLHHGEISPNHAWYAAQHATLEQGCEKDGDHFLSELGWREFSYYLLYHFPTLPTENFQPKFDGFGWNKNDSWLQAWQRGQTGYPIVDAGMRQLWQTGWMHNRVRMIVGSFLIKDLLIDWRDGEAWFWDTLLDADLASNSASWQWVAGSGADASPYFRIFNPITQGEKFDPNGDYVRQYVPELAKLGNKYIHKPWEASSDILEGSCVRLGKDYPHPLVDHKEARDEALLRFKALAA